MRKHVWETVLSSATGHEANVDTKWIDRRQIDRQK